MVVLLNAEGQDLEEDHEFHIVYLKLKILERHPRCDVKQAVTCVGGSEDVNLGIAGMYKVIETMVKRSEEHTSELQSPM